MNSLAVGSAPDVTCWASMSLVSLLASPEVSSQSCAKGKGTSKHLHFTSKWLVCTRTRQLVEICPASWQNVPAQS
jgi:hypothetical protein